MTKTQQLEQLRNTISEYRDLGLHDRAAELARDLPPLEKESDAERVQLRVAAGGHLAALAEVVKAQTAPPPAWQKEVMPAERLARRAALSPMLAAADAIKAQKNSR